MMNSNPETVSTDYDTSSRLYFEPLTVEDVLNVLETERPDGIIVQFGGQTPLKLAGAIQDALTKDPIPAASGEGAPSMAVPLSLPTCLELGTVVRGIFCCSWYHSFMQGYHTTPENLQRHQRLVSVCH